MRASSQIGADMHEEPSNFIPNPTRPGARTAPPLVEMCALSPVASMPSPSSFHQAIRSCVDGGGGDGALAALQVPTS